MPGKTASTRCHSRASSVSGSSEQAGWPRDGASELGEDPGQPQKRRGRPLQARRRSPGWLSGFATCRPGGRPRCSRNRRWVKASLRPRRLVNRSVFRVLTAPRNGGDRPRAVVPKAIHERSPRARGRRNRSRTGPRLIGPAISFQNERRWSAIVKAVRLRMRSMP